MKTPHLITIVAATAAAGFLGGIAFQKRSAFQKESGSKPESTAGITAPERKATTRFMILHPNTPDLFSPPPPPVEDSWLKTQLEVLRSDEILLSVVRHLNLDQEWKLSPDQAVAKIRDKIKVTLMPGTSTVSVTAWDVSYNTAVELANAVRTAYEDFRIAQLAEQFKERTQSAEAKIKEQEEVVRQARQELLDLAKKHNITDAVPLSSTAAADPPSEPRHQSEYAAAKQRNEAAVALLSTLKELLARQKVDEGVVYKPIELLQQPLREP